MNAGRVGARLRPGLVAIGLLGLIATIGLAWLGTWQIERRAWKLDLIARVQHRLAVAPVVARGPGDWPRVTRERDEYRRVRVTGRFLPGNTLVFASTELGAGYWLIAPFRDARGFTVLVNRGYVPSAQVAATVAAEPVTVSGLLRLTEPGGDLLRSNDPAGDRWYSRDVAAIAAKQHLGTVAPYFIDAAGSPDPDAFPRGGLTVISFPNNHLVYALTWYTLMVMVAGATVFVVRRDLLHRQEME